MKLSSNNQEPPTFKAELTPDEIHVIKAAYTDRIVRSLAGEDADEEAVGQVPERSLKLSLLTTPKVDFAPEDLEDARDTLLEFGVNTAKVVRKLALSRHEQFYYDASHIPERIRLGRSALQLAREMAGQRAGGSVDELLGSAGLPIDELTEREEMKQLPPGASE